MSRATVCDRVGPECESSLSRTLDGGIMNPENRSIFNKFQALRKVAPNGAEYWMARDLQPVLGYARFENMESMISRAREACEQSGEDPDLHILRTQEMVSIGSGAERPRIDYFLSRYGGYLLALNGDPGKPEIAAAQTYFTIQARRSEVRDAAERRIDMRDRVRVANRSLAGAARGAGVPSARFGLFQNAGYRGLYGGLGLQEIKQRKRIGRREDLLDRAGEAELAANYFRITQAEQKIERERIHDETAATRAHREVGVEVRKTIARMGGTMPENLPAEIPIKRLRNAHQRKIEAPK